ncbi:hypothetical protein IAR55_000184 [Kwoniella newhampshirensis]|uniref:Uncharacterized protein n=1 Tax=Kwoniella newhampshirensis TaxID=1651941 RepID=A0AAW0Z605_9TREE
MIGHDDDLTPRSSPPSTPTPTRGRPSRSRSRAHYRSYELATSSNGPSSTPTPTPTPTYDTMSDLMMGTGSGALQPEPRHRSRSRSRARQHDHDHSRSRSRSVTPIQRFPSYDDLMTSHQPTPPLTHTPTSTAPSSPYTPLTTLTPLSHPLSRCASPSPSSSQGDNFPHLEQDGIVPMSRSYHDWFSHFIDNSDDEDDFYSRWDEDDLYEKTTPPKIKRLLYMKKVRDQQECWQVLLRMRKEMGVDDIYGLPSPASVHDRITTSNTATSTTAGGDPGTASWSTSATPKAFLDEVSMTTFHPSIRRYNDGRLSPTGRHHSEVEITPQQHMSRKHPSKQANSPTTATASLRKVLDRHYQANDETPGSWNKVVADARREDAAAAQATSARASNMSTAISIKPLKRSEVPTLLQINQSTNKAKTNASASLQRTSTETEDVPLVRTRTPWGLSSTIKGLFAGPKNPTNTEMSIDPCPSNVSVCAPFLSPSPAGASNAQSPFDIDRVTERLRGEMGRISFAELEGLGEPYPESDLPSDDEPVDREDATQPVKAKRPDTGRRWTLPW